MVLKKELEEEILELEVEESPIKSKSGVARIHEDEFKKLDVEKGNSVVVASDSKSILLTIYADKLIGKNKIKIRSDDLKKLEVNDGDKVKLSLHKTSKESI